MSTRIGIDDAAWASPWRRRRVGEKVALSTGLVLTALLAPPWPGTVLVSVVALVSMLALARVRPGLLAAAAAAPLLFLLVSGLGVATRLGGDAPALLRLGPLAVDHASLAQAATLLGHGVAGTLALLLLATTTPMVDLVTWLRALKVPAELLDIAALTYRILFLALSTALAVHAAVLARLGDHPLRPSASGQARQRLDRRRRRHNLAAGATAIALTTGHRAVRMQRGLELRGFESDLHTLPVARERSWAFVAGTAATLAGVWAVTWAVAR